MKPVPTLRWKAWMRMKMLHTSAMSENGNERMGRIVDMGMGFLGGLRVQGNF
jgi:hypothetical protein